VEDGPLRIYVTVQSVWVGSRNGAARFEKESNKWLVYTTQDGLINDSVQALMPDGDYMWFGTTEGVTRFYWNDPARVE
jgi:ligand-binding sensor domain-containing protein